MQNWILSLFQNHFHQHVDTRDNVIFHINKSLMLFGDKDYIHLILKFGIKLYQSSIFCHNLEGLKIYLTKKKLKRN